MKFSYNRRVASEVEYKERAVWRCVVGGISSFLTLIIESILFIVAEEKVRAADLATSINQHEVVETTD